MSTVLNSEEVVAPDLNKEADVQAHQQQEDPDLIEQGAGEEEEAATGGEPEDEYFRYSETYAEAFQNILALESIGDDDIEEDDSSERPWYSSVFVGSLQSRVSVHVAKRSKFSGKQSSMKYSTNHQLSSTLMSFNADPCNTTERFLEQCYPMIRLYHHVLFGNDTYPIKPIIWSALWLTYEIYFEVVKEISAGGILHIIITFFSVVFNLFFGHHFNQTEGFVRMIALYHKNQFTSKEALFLLNRMNLVGTALVILYQVIFYLAVGDFNSIDFKNISLLVLSIPAHIILYGVYIHMCGLWVTLLWPVYYGVDKSVLSKMPFAPADMFIAAGNKKKKASKNIAQDFKSPEMLECERKLFEATIYDIIDEMTKIGNEWQVNHLVRVFSAFFFALNFFQSNAVDTIYMASVYFTAMWGTAIVTSLTNDAFFHRIQGALASISFHNIADNGVIEGNIRSLLLRIGSMYDTGGLHFAGFRFSVQRSFSVGSFLLTIIIFFIKTYS